MREEGGAGGEGKKRRKNGGRGWVGRQSEGLGAVVWVIK